MVTQRGDTGSTRNQMKKAKKGKKRANHNFLWSYKWGPFWQGAAEKPQNGVTDSGAEQQRQRW